MAWTAPTIRATADLITAGIWNTDIVNNLLAVFPAGATYTAYTPVLTAAAVNPALGVGAQQIGRYLQIGKTVHYQGLIAFGASATAAGTGAYRISLPVNQAGTIASGITGIVYVNQASSGNQAAAQAIWDGTAAGYFTMTGTQYAAGGVVPAGISSAAPWAWAASDGLRWALTYEAA